MFYSKTDLNIPALLVLCVFSCAIYLTYSRGGRLALIVGLFVLYFLWVKGFGVPAVSGFVMVLFFIVSQLATGGLGAFDTQGTFQYRYDLILNSMDAVSNNWLLGSADYIGNEQLQQSRQGQGIIDVVNVYLQVYCIVVLGLFLYRYFCSFD